MTPPGHSQPSRADSGDPVTTVHEGGTARSRIRSCAPSSDRTVERNGE